jgi:hypothetical protein
MKRITGTICVLVAFAITVAPAADAHQGDANYRSEITAVSPAEMAGGLDMSVKNFDDSIEMVNRTGRTVVVIGYDGESYLRFSPDGLVEVNLNSPSKYLNEERYADVELPDRADPEADPDWQEVDSTGVFLWHDHRSHYMGEGAPVQVTDEKAETRIFDYAIPLAIDDRPAKARGTLTWVGSDGGVPVAPFIGLILIAAVGVAFILVRRRRRSEA